MDGGVVGRDEGGEVVRVDLTVWNDWRLEAPLQELMASVGGGG